MPVSTRSIRSTLSTFSSRRTAPAVRLGAVVAAAGLVTLGVAAPASAHVSVSASESGAGSYSVLTFSVPHGCDGAATTEVAIQVPEGINSVTPTRNSFYEVEKTLQKLDPPVADAHGNEITERVASIVYTAQSPLPEGQRDTFELSFQVPDLAGETLAFPTIQTCEKGRTGWVEVAEEGDDAELEHPAPAFEVLPAAEEGDGHGAPAEDAHDDSDSAGSENAEISDDSDSNAVGWAGLGLGALGAVAGGTALVRTRKHA